MQKIALPRLFENMEEATVGRWLVREGDAVSVGTPLCELITEKTNLELPAESAGTVRQLVAPEKAVVPVGFILALVGEADEAVPDVSGENAALTSAVSVPTSPHSQPARLEDNGTPAATSTRLRATPAARRAAKDAGVDLELVAARFPGKVLSEDDVRAFAGQS